MSEPKYKRQAEYNRRTYVRFPLDLKPDILAAFPCRLRRKQHYSNHRDQEVHRLLYRSQQALGVIRGLALFSF